MSNDQNRRDPFINQPRPETGQSHPQGRQPRRPNASPYPPVARPTAPEEDFRNQADPPGVAGGNFRAPADPRGVAGGNFHYPAGPPGVAGGNFRAPADPRAMTGGDFRAPAGRARSAEDGRDVPPGRIPTPGAPTAAPRKRSKSPWVFGGLLLIVVLGLAGTLVVALGGPGSVMNALGFDQASKKAVDGRMNTPIADGTFELTVTAARCGLDKVGDGKTAQPAQGQFCLIDVTVKNVGSSPVLFDDISQTAYDATGNQYSADSAADVVANKAQPTFLQQITPGATVHGRLAFDISTRERLTAVVLHESIFSDGVRIPLA